MECQHHLNEDGSSAGFNGSQMSSTAGRLLDQRAVVGAQEDTDTRSQEQTSLSLSLSVSVDLAQLVPMHLLL